MSSISSLEGGISNEDANFWLNDPSFANRRLYVPAETVRDLIVQMFLEEDIDLTTTSNAFFWNLDGPDGPEIVVVRLPEARG